MVQEIAEFLRPEAQSHNVTVEVLAVAESAMVKVDRDLLRQALLNIAVNAVEAMETGGTLRLEVMREHSLCLVRLADTGPGMSPELRSKIFDLYFTTKSSGSGIGLAMAFRAVQLHGGTIEVESVLGEGTVFTVKLPGVQ